MNGNYRAILERRKGELATLNKSIEGLKIKRANAVDLKLDCEQAQAVIQLVARKTQEELKYQISELVTLALAAVFEDPYTFEVDFVTRRNQTEADLWFIRNGERINPLDASGGGAVDVASLALRISLWSLKNPRSCNVLLLDEPFKNLSKRYQVKASAMLKMISEKLDIQIIMVTHSSELIEAADKTFEVSINKGISEVKEISCS